MLNKVKNYLNIDFPDKDEYLKLLISSAISRAESITGKKAREFNAEIEQGIVEDVGSCYVGEEPDLTIYRRNSKRPML